MKFKPPTWASTSTDAVVCLIRKLWRPLVQLGIGGSILVHGVVLPILTRTSPDLTGLAALVAAASPFAVMRSLEKKWDVHNA